MQKNIPYHLGQRNAYYERALELLQESVAEIEKIDLMQIAQYISSKQIKDQLIAYLSKAHENAEYIQEENNENAPLERVFYEYLGLLLEEARTISADTTMQCLLEKEKSCLSKMGVPVEDISLYEPYENLHIKDKIKTIKHFLVAGYVKYKELRDKELSRFSSDEEGHRYKMSYDSVN